MTDDDLFKSLTNDAIKDQELTVDNGPVTTTRLMYLDDVQKGTVMRFNRCRPMTDEEKAERDRKRAEEESVSVGPFEAIRMMMPGQDHDHVDEDVDVTVLDRRDAGGVVSLILVDDNGEQFPYIDMSIKTVKAVVQ